MKKFEMTCICCGVSFMAGNHNAKYCPVCKETEKKRLSEEAKRNARLRKQNREAAVSRKNLVEFLREIDTYNKKHGTRLSYGQYVALKNV